MEETNATSLKDGAPVTESLNEKENSEDDSHREQDGDEGQSTKNTEKPKRLSKTEKKFNRYQRKLASYKQKKLEKKKLKQSQSKQNSIVSLNSEQVTQNPENPINPSDATSAAENASYDTYLNKRELKKKAIERLTNVLETKGSDSLKICIDCSFSDLMSDKELSRLAQQLGNFLIFLFLSIKLI